jgi:hypothetical protein
MKLLTLKDVNFNDKFKLLLQPDIEFIKSSISYLDKEREQNKFACVPVGDNVNLYSLDFSSIYLEDTHNFVIRNNHIYEKSHFSHVGEVIWIFETDFVI